MSKSSSAAHRFLPELVSAALRDPARLEIVARTGLMDTAPEAAFDRWTALASRSLRAPVALITLFDAERPYLKSVVGPSVLQPGAALRTELSICRFVLSDDTPLVIDDARGHHVLRDAPEVAALGLVAYLGTPIRVEGQVIGSLCVAQDAPRAWDADDVALLGDFAEAIAGEVQLRLAADDLGRANEVVASHNRIHELIAAGAPLPDVLLEIVGSIERYDPHLAGSVLLLDPELRTVHHAAAPSLPAPYLAALDGLVIGPEIGSCGPAADAGIEVITPDIDRDPRWAPFLALTHEHGLRHCWSFPIIAADGGVHGTFGVYGDQPREPTDAHRHFLRDAARLAGIAIERNRTTEELVHRATHDPLTGLPNRTLLLDRLTHALARGRRSGAALAVLFVDLDRLKLVNDTLGHEVGDDLLRAVAEELAGCVRPGDTVARFGGDEFIVVAEEVDEVEAAAIAQRIVAAIATVAPAAGHGLNPTASVGVAVIDGSEVDAREAIRRADEAMYSARDEGGNRSRNGHRLSAEQAGRRLQLESALRGALERGEFHLVAQPVTRFAGRELQGVEALLRWTHPELGPVGPDEFVPIAEQTGTIDALGAWVLHEACRSAAALQTATGRTLELGVNVSPRQLRDPGLPGVVARALGDAGLDAERLVIEITETALLGSDPATGRTLDELRRLGVTLVLDDFGTGFSSLSMLKERPIDGIKIDRSFVQGLPGDADSGAIVAAVVGMAHALGRTVTAEGIETDAQLAYLDDLGCDLAQGYLFGRPLPFGELAARLGPAAERA